MVKKAFFPHFGIKTSLTTFFPYLFDSLCTKDFLSGDTWKNRGGVPAPVFPFTVANFVLSVSNLLKESERKTIFFRFRITTALNYSNLPIIASKLALRIYAWVRPSGWMRLRMSLATSPSRYALAVTLETANLSAICFACKAISPLS